MQRMTVMPGFKIKTGIVTLVVPSYYATLPIVEISDGDVATLTGFTGYKRKELDEHLNRVLLRGWQQQLKWFVRYWVRWYYRCFPDLLDEDGQMLGFDATVLARYYWPGEPHGGKAKVYLRKELISWAQNQKTTSAIPD
jgi:hypothetical protein